MNTTEKNITLVGRDTILNQTIGNLLKSRDEFRFHHWTPAMAEKRLEKLDPDAIDVLIADLSSWSGRAIHVIKKLTGFKAVRRILAIHLYSDGILIDELLRAGADGYLPVDTHEQELLDALNALDRNRQFMPSNIRVAKNT